MNEIIDVNGNDPRNSEGLKAWGWVSYVLHLVVAVAAVLPAAQPSVALLLIALVIDLVKRSDADGTWQASHFSWRIRTVVWAGLGAGFNLVFVSHRARHVGDEQRPRARWLSPTIFTLSTWPCKAVVPMAR